MLRGIRGATTVDRDDAEAIIQATKELLMAMVETNSVSPNDLAGAFFVVTPDLQSAFPARAARELGWRFVPLLDSTAPPVSGSLPRCVRVMLLWNTDIPQESVQHTYLRDATGLRPDLTAGSNDREDEENDCHNGP